MQRVSLTRLHDAGTFVMFTENDCTDILAMPDGGGIQTMKHKINKLVEGVVDNNIELWYGSTTPSKSLRRKTLLTALGTAWAWYRTEHTDVPHKIALRTGQVFKIDNDRKKQFSKCSFRGYVNDDLTPKNPFQDQDFATARIEFVERNILRRRNQQERKKKRELKQKVAQEKKRMRKIKEKLK